MGKVAISRWAWIAVGLMVSAGEAHAQMAYHQPCLEMLLADSDLIVRATIVDVTSEPTDKRWTLVTAEVQETLKGPPMKRFVFTTFEFPDPEVFGPLKTSGHDFLFCLIRSARPPDQMAKANQEPNQAPAPWRLLRSSEFGKVAAVLRLEAPLAEPPVNQRGLLPPIFTIDFHLLKERDELLQAARVAIAREPHADGQPVPAHRVMMPAGWMGLTGWSGDANCWYVPVDPSLEVAARAWIESSEQITKRLFPDDTKDERMRRYGAGQLRLEGVRALRYFRSDRNGALLKTLWTDPYYWTQAGVAQRNYAVRKEAYETLRDWGIDVAPPVIKD